MDIYSFFVGVVFASLFWIVGANIWVCEAKKQARLEVYQAVQQGGWVGGIK